MTGIGAQHLLAIKRVGAPSPAPDGSFVVIPATAYDMETNEGKTRLWLHDGGEPRPLTAADTDSKAPRVGPSGGWIAFLRKVGDHSQVFVMDLAGGEAERLTDLPLGASSVRWLPDGSGVLFVAELLAEAMTTDGTRELVDRLAEDTVKAHVTEDRYYRFWDTWLTDGRVGHLFLLRFGAELVDLTPELDARWTMPSLDEPSYDVSPDGERAVFSAAPRHHPGLTTPRWTLHEVDVVGNAVRTLTPDNPADDRSPRYTPDGGSVIFGKQHLLDYYADPVVLTRLDLGTGEQSSLVPEWDLSPGAWEVDAGGERLVITAEERGRVSVFEAPLAGGIPTRLASDGTLTQPRPVSDGSVFLLRQTLSSPPEVVRLRDGAVETVSRFNDDLLEELDLGAAEEMEYPGADGDSIHMFVVYPPDFDPKKKWPLVHMIHGGPHGTFGEIFHFRWSAQTFAAPGYVVALVNFHGSSSYGHDFTRVIHGAWGEKPFLDIEAATDHLLSLGFIDPDRMAITGGSYGGYLTTWIASQTSRYKCAIAHAAVTNQGGMYATDWTTGLARARGANVWEDPETVNRWSPSHHYAGYETPTLVIHGERDFRVPLTQGLELYGVLKAKGVEARLVYYPDENHWIQKPQNSLHWYGEVLGWLERFLG